MGKVERKKSVVEYELLVLQCMHSVSFLNILSGFIINYIIWLVLIFLAKTVKKWQLNVTNGHRIYSLQVEVLQNRIENFGKTNTV